MELQAVREGWSSVPPVFLAHWFWDPPTALGPSTSSALLQLYRARRQPARPGLWPQSLRIPSLRSWSLTGRCQR